MLLGVFSRVKLGVPDCGQHKQVRRAVVVLHPIAVMHVHVCGRAAGHDPVLVCLDVLIRPDMPSNPHVARRVLVAAPCRLWDRLVIAQGTDAAPLIAGIHQVTGSPRRRAHGTAADKVRNMAGEDFDLIEWTVRGSLDAAKWTIEQIAARRRESSLVTETPPRGSLNPNWFLAVTEKHSTGKAYRLTLTKTASAVASNVRVESTGFTSLRFIGDTEWPGEFPTMEPRQFVAADPGFFGEFAPEVTVYWTDIEGSDREETLPVSARFGSLG
jgi:hypothetical protein